MYAYLILNFSQFKVKHCK